MLGDHGLLVPVFFSNWLCQNVKTLIEFQKYFPISAKAMPWSLWKWLGSQRIFEGIKFPNPIGYSPGQAHVTNIDPKCSFFYWAWKSENRIPIFSLVYLGCPWGCILKSTLVAPALKENIFEKVKQNTRKRMSPNTTAKERQRVCMIVLDDHGLSVPPLFFKLTLSKCSKNHRVSEIFSHQCQGHALVSVKVTGLPTHFWRNKIPKPNWL